MFEAICIGEPGVEIDSQFLGFLGECLLFYDQTYVALNHVGFTSLARVCSPDTLLGLLEDGPLQIIYQENRLGIATKQDKNVRHSFVEFEAQKYTAQNHVPKTIQELTGRTGAGRRKGKRFTDRISTRRYNTDRAFGWIEQINDAGDSDHLVKELLVAMVPGIELPADARFRIHREVDGYTVDTSIDFEMVNRAYRSIAIDARQLTPTWVLSHLYESRANLEPAAERASEVGASPLSAALARSYLETCFKKAQASAIGISSFQEVLLEAHSVGEALASGQKNFEDLRHLIEEARKFRDWVRNQSPDADLLREYTKACSTVSWAEKMPNKAKRFFLFNAVGIGVGLALDPLQGALVGLGLNAIDSFLLEYLVAGWRPSQFVAGPLKSFVE